MTATLKSTIEGIKTLRAVPERGKRFLSVNCNGNTPVTDEVFVIN